MKMQPRRRSLCLQAQSCVDDTIQTNRASSFTLRSQCNGDDGQSSLQEPPLFIQQASTRLKPKSRFRFPGSWILRAGLAGFRRHKNAPAMRYPRVWVDTPKDGMSEAEHRPVARAKSTTALRDRCHSRCTDASSEDIDFIINEGVFNLPRNGPVQRSMFTLSRLPEAEAASYLDSLGAPSNGLSARRDSGRPKLRLRSSASSIGTSTPRKSDKVDTDKLQVALGDFAIPSDPVGESNRQKLDSDKLMLCQKRSQSSMDVRWDTEDDDIIITNTTVQNQFTPTQSPMCPMNRPLTRLGSHICDGQGKQNTYDGVVTCGLSDVGYSDRSGESITLCDQPASFRSDQVVFHSSVGYKQMRLDTGFLFTGRSEENACIGKKRTDGTATKTSADLRRVKNLHVDRHSTIQEPSHDTPMDVNNQLNLADYASELFECPTKSKASHLDDDCSVMEEPRNLSMWLEWLEERSDVTRKEILYRMGCQKAFIQEAQDKLKSHALPVEDLEDVSQPNLKDRLAIVRRQCIRKARRSKNKSSRRASLQISLEEFVDIDLDAVDEPEDESRRRSFGDLMLNL